MPTFVQPLSTLPLPTSSSPITHIKYHPTQPLLFILTSDKTLSVLRIRTESEIEKKKLRRKKRAAEKKGETEAVPEEKEYTWGDRFALWTQVHGSAKIKSFSFPSDNSPEATSSSTIKPTLNLLLHLTTNTLESHSIPLPPSTGKPKSSDPVESKRLSTVEVQGHRSDVRALDVSAGDDMLASGSNGQLKVWNLKSLACIRTMESGYVVCLTWLPGDRHVRPFSSNSPFEPC